MKNQEKFYPTRKLPKPLDEGILIAGDQEEMDKIVSEANQQAIYFGWEVLCLKGMDEEMIKAIHETKRIFPGAIIAKVIA